MTATVARIRNTLALQMALDRQRLAHRVVELREKNRLTQMGLMETSGVSLRTVQRIEDPKDQREVRHSTLERIATALGVEPEELTANDALLGRGEEPSPLSEDDRLDRLEDQFHRIEGLLNVIVDHFKLQAAVAAYEREHGIEAREAGDRRRRPEAA